MGQSKYVLEVTDADFDTSVLKSDQLAIVDFWAEWCGPCRQLAPTIEAIANDYAGKVKVYKMNVDNNPTIPTQYHIRGIPTVILFQGGQVVDQIVGNQPKDVFVNSVQKFLK